MSATVAGPATPPAADAFGGRARKLATLLGVPAGGRAVLAGEGLEGWADDFSAHFPRGQRVPSIGAAELAGGGMELVVWRPARGEVAGWLARVRRALAPGGRLLLLGENRIAAGRLARGGAFARGGLTLGRYRRALREAGFGRVHEFLPLPDLRLATEFVGVRSRESALPAYGSRLERALARVGVYPFFHDGYAFVASVAREPFAHVLEKTAEEISVALGTAEEMEVERFDLRRRGALVLFLRARSSGARWVCRVTTTPEVERVVGENTRWTRTIHADPRIHAEVRERVPRPLASFALPEGRAHVEERVDGVVAWKVAPDAGREAVMCADLRRFAAGLSRGTARRGCMTPDLAGHLLRAPHRPWLDGETEEELGSLRACLGAAVTGRECTVVWTHGDFGYGNAIVDPASGTLRGVIDWDQARDDLAGVDLLNFLVQRDATLRRVSLDQAFAAVAGRVAAGGFRAVGDTADYDRHFIFPGGAPVTAAWTGMRIAERATLYPHLFATSREPIQAILRAAFRLLEGAPQPSAPPAHA